MVKIKAQTVARIATRPLYGYMKDPDDPKRHIVPDPDTAPVVKRIFALCADGMGPSKTAQQLEKEQVLTLSYYCYEKYGVKLTGLDTSRPFAWSATTISRILENETYLGVTVNMKTTTISYKNKKRIDRPESEQFRFEGTHEPLIGRHGFTMFPYNHGQYVEKIPFVTQVCRLRRAQRDSRNPRREFRRIHAGGFARSLWQENGTAIFRQFISLRFSSPRWGCLF